VKAKKEDKQITESDWPSEERIDRIGRDGATGCHYWVELYSKAVKAGVYES
jgi:hypothetical protein